jgi:putative Ca2+/H+ antiporter (TMEM165/GDT1 family)
MEAFLVSIGLVALAEIGDKTQLLSLVLAARFRRPWPIVLGIFIATLFNHTLAGIVGAWLTHELGPTLMMRIVGATFIAMAIWALIPDKLGEGTGQGRSYGGVVGTTIVMFFLAEMGDKTQVATVALAARYPGMLGFVVAGTTLGMLLANGPVVFFGDAIAKRVPLVYIRRATAIFFVALGVLAFLA